MLWVGIRGVVLYGDCSQEVDGEEVILVGEKMGRGILGWRENGERHSRLGRENGKWVMYAGEEENGKLMGDSKKKGIWKRQE